MKYYTILFLTAETLNEFGRIADSSFSYLFESFIQHCYNECMHKIISYDFEFQEKDGTCKRQTNVCGSWVHGGPGSQH